MRDLDSTPFISVSSGVTAAIVQRLYCPEARGRRRLAGQARARERLLQGDPWAVPVHGAGLPRRPRPPPGRLARGRPHLDLLPPERVRQAVVRRGARHVLRGGDRGLSDPPGGPLLPVPPGGL